MQSAQFDFQAIWAVPAHQVLNFHHMLKSHQLAAYARDHRSGIVRHAGFYLGMAEAGFADVPANLPPPAWVPAPMVSSVPAPAPPSVQPPAPQQTADNSEDPTSPAKKKKKTRAGKSKAKEAGASREPSPDAGKTGMFRFPGDANYHCALMQRFFMRILKWAINNKSSLYTHGHKGK